MNDLILFGAYGPMWNPGVSLSSNNLLQFGIGNAKVSVAIATFSLPAGHTCPCANECLAKSNRFTGRITDGPDARFRCFAAMGEARATTVRIARWRNFELLQAAKTVQGMTDLINRSIPLGIKYVRIHVSGDFFSENYFKAWVNVAIANPTIVFYAYTKSLHFWVKHKKSLPKNFRLTASKGGKMDSLIVKHKLKYAEVVFSEQEATEKGLELDHDDSHAIEGKKPFGLLLHGGQKAGTAANKAWQIIMKLVGGYRRKKNIARTQPKKSIEVVLT